jgi:hypothetical protein
MSDMKMIEDLTLPDADGDPVRVGDLWAHDRLLIVWLRHYG